jgi:predicted PurR-regulated permease PerM
MREDGRLPTRRSRLTADFVEVTFHLACVGFLMYWAFIFVQPFMPIIIWSSVLAVALHPTFDRLRRAIGGRNRLAAAIMVLAGLLVVIGPSTWVVVGILDGTTSFVQRIDSGALQIPPPAPSIKEWPLLGAPLYGFWEHASQNLRSALGNISPDFKVLGALLLEMASGAGAATLKFLISVIMMGVLLSSGPGLVTAVKRLARRINPGYGERFVELAGATIRAVSRGVIGIALLQGGISGIGMWLAGVPFASFLTLGIIVLSIIQIGPLVIALPLVAWSWAVMPTFAALALTISMTIVYFIELFIKPFVLTHGLTTPTLVIFIGVVGGIIAQGIPGLFIGPIVLAVAWEFAMAWIHQGAVPEATVFSGGTQRARWSES